MYDIGIRYPTISLGLQNAYQSVDHFPFCSKHKSSVYRLTEEKPIIRWRNPNSSTVLHMDQQDIPLVQGSVEPTTLLETIGRLLQEF